MHLREHFLAPCWWDDVNSASYQITVCTSIFADFLLLSLETCVFFAIIYSGFPTLCQYTVNIMCRFMPYAILYHVPFCAICLPFCASAVMFYAILSLCRFVLMPFREMPFCMCIMYSTVHIKPLICNTLGSWLDFSWRFTSVNVVSQ